MTVYEQRKKRSEAIADIAYRHDARKATPNGQSADLLDNDDWVKPRGIETDASLHLLSRLNPPAAPIEADENAEPRCPVCGGPVKEFYKNYRIFTVCSESLQDGANCAWYKPGKIGDGPLTAPASGANPVDGVEAFAGDDYGQVPPP